MSTHAFSYWWACDPSECRPDVAFHLAKMDDEMDNPAIHQTIARKNAFTVVDNLEDSFSWLPSGRAYCVVKSDGYWFYGVVENPDL